MTQTTRVETVSLGLWPLPKLIVLGFILIELVHKSLKKLPKEREVG